MKKVTKIILIIFAVLIVLGVAAGIFAWNYYKEGIAPVSDKSKEVIVTVENGQTATSVLYTLEEAGLVNEDGSINIPEALRPYMGGKEKLIPKH